MAWNHVQRMAALAVGVASLIGGGLVAAAPAGAQVKPVGPAVAVAGGYFVNVDSGKCLDAVWSHSNGTSVTQWDCYGGATQQWSWNGQEIVNTDSGKCLDAVWSHSNGTAVTQWDCYGGATQLWTLRLVNGGYEVVNVDSGKCLDAVWSHSNGTVVNQWDCYGGATQLWHG
ncbi:ricin-type beta-trefoil lectin domain protein [Streptomyces sp. SID13666]|uniref:RICIN domain-containing protein n=1 Tax=unclassified Streptomyces TaxID=2593676 RepID=UPI0013BF0C2A|nr:MULTISPECIES: RICIN domain-containing protein [unclassified Streptomyces]NEA53154.1 ricin-type beta-trefoil lectin domain protein [Streptomyces sp. SID13666]NEA69519.1 ricin-type beta-trefoil lectin domain protein [Streptomyces sp. SID13588]